MEGVNSVSLGKVVFVEILTKISVFSFYYTKGQAASAPSPQWTSLLPKRAKKGYKYFT